MTNFEIIHSVLCFMTCFFGDFASRLCQGWVIVCRTVRLVHSPDRPSSWWSGSRLLHRPSLVAVCLPVHYETCMVHCLPFGLYRETVKQPIHVEVAPTRLGQSCRFGSHRLSWSPAQTSTQVMKLDLYRRCVFHLMNLVIQYGPVIARQIPSNITTIDCIAIFKASLIHALPALLQGFLFLVYGNKYLNSVVLYALSCDIGPCENGSRLLSALPGFRSLLLHYHCWIYFQYCCIIF